MDTGASESSLCEEGKPDAVAEVVGREGCAFGAAKHPDEISPDPLRGASFLCVTKRALSVPVSLVEGCAKDLFFFDGTAREDMARSTGIRAFRRNPHKCNFILVTVNHVRSLKWQALMSKKKLQHLLKRYGP